MISGLAGKEHSGRHSLHSVDGTQDPPSHQASSGGSIPRDPFVWDGEPSWEWDYQRTLYFEPVAGLGNRLRGLGRLSSDLPSHLTWQRLAAQNWAGKSKSR